MRIRFSLLLAAALLLSGASYADVVWKRVAATGATSVTGNINAAHYEVFTTDEAALKSVLFSLATQPGYERILQIPLPDGTLRDFRVRYTPMMPDELAARYPELKTFSGVAADNPGVTAKIDFTVYGFHAMVFGEQGISFTDPADDTHSGYYTSHYKKDEIRQDGQEDSRCTTVNTEPPAMHHSVDVDAKGYRVGNGHQLRTYSLALSCSNQYAAAATGTGTPTIAQVLSKMTTTMNRVNGVYERELSVTMVFVAKEDTLIWTSAVSPVNGPDPFSTINSNANACLAMNQTICTDRIGTSNFDLGHVFTTGAGGLSQIGVVCNPVAKAQSVTGRANPTGDGFDIDYVAHEIGHQFGGNHTFNNGLDGSCDNGNRYGPSAYEPGSGSTIMAYAGICSPDDLQKNSDDYFHAVSLNEINYYITNFAEGCATKTATGNKLVYIPSFTKSYAVPYKTPFELTAPTATDSVASSLLTYCWEQYNLSGVSDAGQRLVNVQTTGPVFRSYVPAKSPTRVFPRDSMMLAGMLSDAGKDDAQGEKIPVAARYLTFKLTMRNIFNGKGAILIPDDTVHLDVINTGEGFAVTSQDDSTAVYVGGSTHTVSWKLAGTNAAPINASSVDIYMSEDGGYTWPHYIGNFPNTGSASIPLANPAMATNKARIKVKGNNNVFFNVNKYNFSLTHSDGTDTAIAISPVPARTTLRVASGNKGVLQFQIFDMMGRQVYAGTVNGLLDIPVYFWSRGMYIIRMIDAKNEKTIKKFVVE